MDVTTLVNGSLSAFLATVEKKERKKTKEKFFNIRNNSRHNEKLSYHLRENSIRTAMLELLLREKM